MITSAVVTQALVDIDASLLVLWQLVARRTEAQVAADGVGTIMWAPAIQFETLVDIQAGKIISVQIMSFVASACVTA